MKNFKLVISSILIAFIYILAVTLFMNASLVKDTFLGYYDLTYKFKIVLGLIGGMWTSMSGAGFFLFATTAILTGANISLMSQKLNDLKKQGNLKIAVGGGSLFGVISSGCVACGLPILTILGLGSSFAFLPLRGLELSYISVIILSVTLYLLTKPNYIKSCNINK